MFVHTSLSHTFVHNITIIRAEIHIVVYHKINKRGELPEMSKKWTKNHNHIWFSIANETHFMLIFGIRG